MNNEETRLEQIASNSLYGAGANAFTIKYSFEILKRYLKGNVLEMGPAEGIMTEQLVNVLDTFSIVEGSQLFVNDLKLKYPKLDITCSLFENYKPSKTFDVIVLGHVLEHVDNPVEILKKAKKWLNPNGIIFAAVPNAHSIHRQAAVLMGILDKENSMSELDYHHGHRRVYNFEDFKQDFIQAGLSIKKCGGYWLKPVSNKQIEETWTEEMIYAFMQLGEKYPEIAGEIYIVAEC